MAITRNASESLEILQYGIDLKRGDEVSAAIRTTRGMITTFKQRERRDGIVLKTVLDPACRAATTPRWSPPTKRTHDRPHAAGPGQPRHLHDRGDPAGARDRRVGARRGIPAIVDGAHAFAHVPFRRADLGCDNYSVQPAQVALSADRHRASLRAARSHQGRLAADGAPRPEQDANIRKFEEIGTHPAANTLAIAEALGVSRGDGRRARSSPASSICATAGRSVSRSTIA